MFTISRIRCDSEDVNLSVSGYGLVTIRINTADRAEFCDNLKRLKDAIEELDFQVELERADTHDQ